MELERTTESLESFVAYNLMAENISEAVLIKDYRAEYITNIISAEMIAQPILESISYYNLITPDTIYVINGTYELKYYASSHMYMESKERLLEELNDSENVGWRVWERRNSTKEGSEPALMYICRTWKRECWLFFISVEQLDAIINADQSVTVLQDRDGMRLYPFVSDELSDTPGFVGDEDGYCEITVSASNGSFTLTRYIDEDYLFAEVNVWQNYFFTVIIAVLLAGGILILLLTTFNEHPIRKLQRDWRKKIPDMPENVMGLEALQFAMKSMEEQVVIMETKQKKNHLLLQLIYGKDCETENFQKRMKDAGLFQHAEVYRVLIAVSDEQQEQEVSINKLGVYLDMFREEGFELRVIETSSPDASIIIAGMTKASEKELKSKLLQIVEEIDRSVNKKISVYVGGKCEKWEKIHLSYTQALSCSQNRELGRESDKDQDNKRVIYYQSVTRKSIGKFQYPSAELNTLYTALVETDMDKASAVTERLVEILQKQSENRFISVSLYYDVLNIYYGAQAKLDLDLDSNFLEVDLLEILTAGVLTAL